MKNDGISRRDFVRSTSVAAAGTIAGALAGEEQAAKKDASKIVNFNEDMHYRRDIAARAIKHLDSSIL